MTIGARTPTRTRRDSRAAGGLLLSSVATLFAFSLVCPPNAHAYIDPGSGALIWQAALAAFFGAMFYMRGFLRLMMEKLGLRSTKASAKPVDEKRADGT